MAPPAYVEIHAEVFRMSTTPKPLRKTSSPFEAEAPTYTTLFFDSPRRVGGQTSSGVSALPGRPITRHEEGAYVYFAVHTIKGIIEVPAASVASAVRTPPCV